MRRGHRGAHTSCIGRSMGDFDFHPMTKQLYDAAQLYLQEALYCSNLSTGPVQGFATMCTVFPVMLAFGELIVGKYASDSVLIERFCEYMPTATWLMQLGN